MFTFKALSECVADNILNLILLFLEKIRPGNIMRNVRK